MKQIEKMELQELNQKDLVETNGGIWLAIAGLYLGYAYFTYNIGYTHGKDGLWKVERLPSNPSNVNNFA